MQVVLYQFNKRADSIARPTSGGVTVNCNIKDGSSIIFPVLMLKQSTSQKYNYVYIPEWRRYYWVTDTVSDHHFVYYKCEVDVNPVMWDLINQTVQYVTRSAYKKDPDVVDSYLAPSTEIEYRKVNVTNPFDLSYGDHYGIDKGCFLLKCAAGYSDNGSIPAYVPENIGGLAYYYMTPSQMKNFIQYLVGEYQYIKTNPAAELLGITKQVLKEIINPLSWIRECYYIPYDIRNKIQDSDPHYGPIYTFAHFLMGEFDLTSIVPNLGSVVAAKTNAMNVVFDITNEDIILPDHPKATLGNFMYSNAWSEYILRTNFWGDIKLDGNVLAGLYSRKINIKTQIDINGYARLTITAKDCINPVTHVQTPDVIMFYEEAFVGVQFSLSQFSKDRIGLAGKIVNNAASGIQAGASMATGFGASFNTSSHTSMGISTGNDLSNVIEGGNFIIPGNSSTNAFKSTSSLSSSQFNSRALASDVSGAAGALGSYGESCIGIATHAPKAMSSGTSGSFLGLFRDWWLDAYFIMPIPDTENLRGKPLCKFIKLAKLMSYTKILNPKIENTVVNGVAYTITEIRMMLRNMEAGFFIEGTEPEADD